MSPTHVVAVKVTEAPIQIALDSTAMVGNGLTVTTPLPVASQLAPFLQTTL